MSDKIVIKVPYNAFLERAALCVQPFGDGHINDSFLVETEDGEYVCQRIRKAMDVSCLEHNYLLYAEACEKANWPYPKWMKTQDGKLLYKDQAGDHWRTYPLIKGQILSSPLSKEELYACGQGLSRMHVILQTLPRKPKPVYPMLHDLKHYYERYLRMIRDGACFDDQRDCEVERFLHENIEVFTCWDGGRKAVIHGDPKLGNIVFQDGRVKAFIDLDTIMEGSLLEDLADCVRSCCLTDGRLDQKAVQILLDGYLSVANHMLTEEEIRKLPDVIRKICFELGLRYYTDSIAHKKSFKEKYPGYLLGKAKGYFEKVQSKFC